MRHLFVLLLPLLLAFGGCAKQGEPGSPVQIDPDLQRAIASEAIINGLYAGGVAANNKAASSAAAGNTAACAVQSLGGDLLIVGSTIAALVASDGGSPSVDYEVSAGECGIQQPATLPDLHAVESTVIDIVSHVQTRLQESPLRPYMEAMACRELSIADGVVAGILGLSESLFAALQAWDLSISGSFAIDYLACSPAPIEPAG